VVSVRATGLRRLGDPDAYKHAPRRTLGRDGHPLFRDTEIREDLALSGEVLQDG